MFQLPIIFGAAVLFFLGLLLLFALVQVGMISTAFAKLGLSNSTGFLLLLGTLVGSGINVPIWRSRRLTHASPPPGAASQGVLFRHVSQTPAPTIELTEQVWAINVGGCIIPCLLSAYLISHIGVSTGLILATAVVTAACYWLAQPVQGVGIGIPIFYPPLITALAAMAFAPAGTSAHVAYVSGSLGTLLGADLLHLATPRSRQLLDAPVLSVGGAGTFDGIFITGIVAVLLA